MRIVFLYEDELRIAAKALQAVYDFKGDDLERGKVLQAAFRAAHIALYHLGNDSNDDAYILVDSKPTSARKVGGENPVEVKEP